MDKILEDSLIKEARAIILFEQKRCSEEFVLQAKIARLRAQKLCFGRLTLEKWDILNKKILKKRSFLEAQMREQLHR